MNGSIKSPQAGASLPDRLAEIEARLSEVESDEAWDALEPDVRKLMSAVITELESDKLELPDLKAAQRKKFQWWDYVNPFDAEARDQWKSTVGRKQMELEHDRTLLERTRKLRARFYADKTRKHARAFIRVAEKIQRGVSGAWQEKASVVFGAAASERSGDEALEAHRTVKGALTRHWEAIGPATAAALLAKPTDEQLRAADAEVGIDEVSTRSLPSALIFGHDGTKRLSEVRKAMGQRALPGDQVLASAAVLSDLPAEAAWAQLEALEAAAGANLADRPRIAAAALLAGVSADELRGRLEAFDAALPDLGGQRGIVCAALLLADGDRLDDAQVLLRQIRGPSHVVATLTAASILSTASIDESLAFIDHVQTELTGTWNSEALIVAGGVLAGERSALKTKHLFTVPGFVTELDED